MQIVATTTSRYGGRLDCGHVAKPGDVIHKADVGLRGPQTKGGHGQGRWYCGDCADELLAAELDEGGAA